MMLIFVFQTLGEHQCYLFNNDSGAYLLNSIELKVPGDRTVFYSLWIWFLREIMGIHSLFPVVFLPFWMVVYGLCLVSNHLLLNAQIIINQTVLLTALMVGIWISGALNIAIQIMPDIFTSLLFLSWYLFVAKLKLNQGRQAFFWGILMVISSVMHNAHLLVIIGLFVLNFLFNKDHLFNKYKIKYVFLYFMPFFLVIGSNVVSGNGITLSKNASVFLVAKMSENGLLKKYLDKNCEVECSALCQYKNDLPVHAWDYIWPEDGIHMKVGGWYHTDSLYRKILWGIASDKQLLGDFLTCSLIATYKQLLLLGVGDGIIRAEENSTIIHVLTEYYNFENEQIISKRNTSFDYSQLNGNLRKVFLTVVILFVITFLYRFRSGSDVRFLMEFYTWFVVFLWIQAFSTGALANILMRLNIRAIWLVLPLSLVFVFGEVIQMFHKFRIWFLRKNT